MSAGVGRMLIVFGLALVVIGALVEFAPWLRLGRLPGDISFGSGNVRVYFPIVTCLVLSLVFTLLFSLLSRR